MTHLTVRSLFSSSTSYLQRNCAAIIVTTRQVMARNLLAIGRRLDDQQISSPADTKRIEMSKQPSKLTSANPADAERVLLLKSMLGIALPLWRARRRLRQDLPEGSAAHAALRHLDQALGFLHERGFEIEDYCGQVYDAGMSAFVSPVSFDERADCARDTIVETLAPAVSFRGTLLTKSEVVVGVPAQPAARAAPPDCVEPPPAEQPASTRSLDGAPSGLPSEHSDRGSPAASPASAATQDATPQIPLAIEATVNSQRSASDRSKDQQ
jgi:hypothetical protein